MDTGTIVIVVLAVIIIAAAVGIIASQVTNHRNATKKVDADAFATRMSAITFALKALPQDVPHKVTIDNLANFTVRPVEQSAAQVTTQPTSDSVRYKVDTARPDTQQRRDLLKIVRYSAMKYGPTHDKIVSGNRCQRDGLLSGPDWQKAIDYGKELFGVVAANRESTRSGDVYQTLGELEDAINEYATVN